MDAANKHKWKITKSLDAQDRLAIQDGSSGHQLLGYSYDTFVEYLVRFIVADDQVSATLPDFHLSSSFRTQSLRVVDCPEFRDICWILRPNLEHIPHRDSIRERVTVEWGEAFKGLCDELAVGQLGPACDEVVLTHN